LLQRRGETIARFPSEKPGPGAYRKKAAPRAVDRSRDIARRFAADTEKLGRREGGGDEQIFGAKLQIAREVYRY